MNDAPPARNRRILLIDDNQAIHSDFRKVIGQDETGSGTSELLEAEIALFGESTDATSHMDGFTLDSAYQGQEGLEKVREALRNDRPYALAFVDVRMPPGWDGVETVSQIWREDPSLQVVICTAYSDYTWPEMIDKLGQTDHLMILKKPFDTIEVRQLAFALTEKWNLARQVGRRMEDMEQMVQDRTSELLEQKNCLETALFKLQEAQSQLVQADKMASIGQLAAGVAHEINNPIGFITSNLNSLGQYIGDLKRVIASYDDLLQNCLSHSSAVDAKADAARRVRDEIDLSYVISDLDDLIAESVEGTQRVRQIVADLRDFSHIDNPDVSEVDMNQLIDKTVNVAWNELKYKAEVVREYGEPPPLPCFGGKVGQVILNLLVNAAHAIDQRGKITIRTGHDDANVWAEIEDTGCGISPENQQRVFEPFFTTKDVGKGTGMGLHLAYKIIDAHGGRISVRSVVGEGTTFRVVLPRTGPPLRMEERCESSA